MQGGEQADSERMGALEARDAVLAQGAKVTVGLYASGPRVEARWAFRLGLGRLPRNEAIDQLLGHALWTAYSTGGSFHASHSSIVLWRG